ncbi:UNVERIFIED_CONTAM: Sm-like protein LSM36B [Sesamum calycinum]|uniref:Sm-like protein LSM36B n=1 Tax=Sesamum calycinum TaxID=2727403 RepID=A0AAW2QYQ6_9LAMI
MVRKLFLVVQGRYVLDCSGADYVLNSPGILACLDGYMNIAMEQTEEYVNGQLKNKYGDAFIRGNNVLYISTSKGTLAEGA